MISIKNKFKYKIIYIFFKKYLINKKLNNVKSSKEYKII